MWAPHPAHDGFSQFLQVTRRHMTVIVDGREPLKLTATCCFHHEASAIGRPTLAEASKLAYCAHTP